MDGLSTLLGRWAAADDRYVITFGCVYIVLYYLCVYTDSMYISLYLLRSTMPCITHIHIHMLIYIVLTYLYTIYIGNYIAVGTFDPTIEIWNLDVLDPLEPTASLGGILSKKKKRMHKTDTKKTMVIEYKKDSHEGAVMSLSWNKHYRQALSSGSADNTVKIWVSNICTSLLELEYMRYYICIRIWCCTVCVYTMHYIP